MSDHGRGGTRQAVGDPRGQLARFREGLSEADGAQFDRDAAHLRSVRLGETAADFQRLEASFREAGRRTADADVLRREMDNVLARQAGQLLLQVIPYDGLSGSLYRPEKWVEVCCVAADSLGLMGYTHAWISFVRWHLIRDWEARFRPDWREVFYPQLDDLRRSPIRAVGPTLPEILNGRTKGGTLSDLHACADIHAIACAVVAETLDLDAERDLPGCGGGKPVEVKTKRSTSPGEAREKIVAGLTEHHKFNDEGCGNLEPIKVNEFAKRIGVSASTVSEFLKGEFGGYTKYRGHFCRDAATLVMAIKMIRGELPPSILYNRIKNETAMEDPRG